MRCSSTAFILVCLCSAPLYSQASRTPPPKPTPVPTISRPAPKAATSPSTESLAPIKLEDQWTTALVKRDTRTFDRLLAPNFVYTEDAAVMTRSDVIKSVTGSDRVEWARNEGMKLHDFGDVHVITGVLHLRGKGKDGPFNRRYQFTDTWQLRNDGSQRDSGYARWQIIAAQDYLIPK